MNRIKKIKSAAMTAFSWKTIAFWFAIVSLFVILLLFQSNSAFMNKYKDWEKFIDSITQAVFSLMVIGGIYDFLVRRDTVSMFLEALYQQDVMKLYSDERIEEIGRRALSQLFRDDDFGRDLFDTVRTRVKRVDERWYDYRSSFIIEPSNVEDLRDKYYDVTCVMEYRKRIHTDKLFFRVVDSVGEQEKYVWRPDTELCFLNSRPPERNLFDDDFFLVSDVRLQSTGLEIKRDTNDLGDNVFYVDIPQEFQRSTEPQKILLKFHLKSRKRGHLMSQGPIVPTKNVLITLSHRGTDIGRVRMIGFFASGTPPTYMTIPNEKDPHEYHVSVDGWVLPRSGVVFVWALKDELALEPIIEMPLSSQGGTMNGDRRPS